MPDCTDANSLAAQCLYSEARQRYEQGDYLGARQLAGQARTLFEALVEADHQSYAAVVHLLASLSSELGDVRTARDLAQQALDIRREWLGLEHPDTLASLYLLGDSTCDCGDLQAGFVLVEQAYTLRRRVLGAEHPDTVENMAVLALLLAHQSRRREAEQLLLQAQDICLRVFGEQHPTTVRVLNGLGAFWSANEETYAQSRLAYERALATAEALFGPDHMQVGRLLSNLGAVLADMGQLHKAQEVLERSLAIHQRSIGLDNIHTSFVLNNLAAVESRQHNDIAAIPLLKRSLIICERTVGAYHPQTISSLWKLVNAFGNLGDHNSEMGLSMALYQCLTALEAGEGEPPGPQQQRATEHLHRLVVQIEAELQKPALSTEDQEALRQAQEQVSQAQELIEQGHYTQAEAHLEQALALQERVLGASHLDHVHLLELLSQVKGMLGQHSAILSLQQRIVALQKELLGPENPQTLLAQIQLMSHYTSEYGAAGLLSTGSQLLESLQDSLGIDDRDDHDIHTIDRAMGGLGKLLQEAPGSLERPTGSRSKKRKQTLSPMLPTGFETVLEGLEDIDWHHLEHAYGPADDVPEMLRLLLSDSAELRSEAWDELVGSLAHQGDICSATAAAVPFFLRMLAHPSAPDRFEVLGYLAYIAEETRMPHTYEDEQETHKALAAGVPLLLELCEQEAELRASIAMMLGWFPERAAEIRPVLHQLLAEEDVPGVQAALLLALADVMGASAETQAFFVEQMRSAESNTVRFVAAVALIDRMREQAHDDAVEVIMQVIARLVAEAPKPPSEEDISTTVQKEGLCGACATLLSMATEHPAYWEGAEDARHGAFWNLDGFTAALVALSKLGPQRDLPLLLQVLSTLQQYSRYSNDAVVLVLALAFGAEEGLVRRKGSSLHDDGYVQIKPVAARLDAKALTAEQRRVLEALLAYDPLWNQDHNPLKQFGLPTHRGLLRHFLSGDGEDQSPLLEQ